MDIFLKHSCNFFEIALYIIVDNFLLL